MSCSKEQGIFFVVYRNEETTVQMTEKYGIIKGSVSKGGWISHG